MSTAISTSTDLAEAVARLDAERAIRDTLVRYCRAIDRLDIDLLRTVYHVDGTDDHGVYSGPVEGFVAFIAAGPSRGFEMTQHCLYQTLIILDGDVAHAETYFSAYHRRRHNGELLEEMTGARYVDRFECRDGGWRIAHRQVITDWTRVIPLPPGFWSGDAFGANTPAILSNSSAFTHGVRSSDDPSYELMQR